MSFQYDKCFCERCDEAVYVPTWNVPESSHDIVSLCDMGINPDVDFVCVNCLTDEESDKVDAYFSAKAVGISAENYDEMMKKANQWLMNGGAI